MIEWWTKSYQALLQEKISRAHFQEAINQNLMQFRLGTESILEKLDHHHIPLLVFSAGLGDVIDTFLETQQVKNKYLHLISNFMIYDNIGIAFNYTQPIIHSLNKHTSPLENPTYGNQIRNRKNLILLGDHLGDARMGENREYDTVIKIGFLNDDVDNNLELYKKTFDVVITNDGPMDFVNELLQKVAP